MSRKEIIIGITGILLILLALAGTGSAHSVYGSVVDSNCGFCHIGFPTPLTANGIFFKDNHKFDGLTEPLTSAASCTNCHTNLTTVFLPLTSDGSFYNNTHRYNDTMLAAARLSPPACGNCHVNVINNNFTRLSGTPTYLISTTCEACHKAKYDNWTNTLHRVMLTERSKAQAMNLPEPEVGWANISYVIVTKFEFAYINTTGYFLSQNDAYETETGEFVNSSHAGGAYGTCGVCHTTNWNASARNSSLPGFNGTFSEPGIACERCHEPAGNGHQVVVNYSGDQCLECHYGSRHGTGWENGKHAPPPYEIGSNCMFCHSSFDQYKNQNVTKENATGVSCGVCHNTHDITDNKYAETFSEGIFNATTWSEVADSKLSFFNATASIAAGTDIFDTLVSPALLYPGTDTSRKDPSYGTEPINVTGPVSEVLCSMCHYRHGLAHTAGVNLTHSRINYPQSEWATCTDCHMGGTNATVGKDMMKNHANDPLTPNSCGGTTKCHTTSDQNLSASSYSVIPVIKEWEESLHNDKVNGRFYNNGTGMPRERESSCSKCHSPANWNPANEKAIVSANAFKGVTCAVCHNIHDMGEWLKQTGKAYAWYNRDAIPIYNSTGAITRYKANYSIMENTTELCGNCHANILEGRTGPGWASDTAANPISPHGFPAKDVFDGSVKQNAPYNFECISCHMATMIRDSNGSVLPDSQKVTGHSFKVNATILMNGTACSSCHVTGSTLGNLSTTIDNIQAETRDKWNATNITVLNALATINAFDGEKNLSRDLIAEAYWNLRLVSSDGSWGVHNPEKVNNLLNESSTLASDAIAALGSAGKPNITSFSPTTPTVIDVVGGPTRTFSITANQAVNVTWQINETEVTNETGVTTSSYSNSSAAQGIWNVTAVAQNANGSAVQKWTWVVNPISPGTFNISGFKINNDTGTGVPDWPITLTNDNMTVPTTTNNDGMYQFTGLANGTYTVNETVQSGWMNVTSTSIDVLIDGADVMNQNFTNQPIPTPAFIAILSGSEEVPAVDTQAQGQATFNLNLDTLHFTVVVSNITNTTASHIHLAPAGQNGLIVAFLYPGPTKTGRFDGVLAEGNITAENLTGPLEGMPLSALIDNMTAGNTYVNVHTVQNPGGEIRGQIKTVAPAFSISGFKINNDTGIGVPDWPITLTNDTMTVPTTTNNDGMYQFTGLMNGTYTIAEDMRAGWTNVSQMSIAVVLNGSDVMNQNFTNMQVQPGETFNISGFKIDNDTGMGIANWNITLTKPDSTVMSNMTDPSGMYRFTGLANGTYTVAEEMQAGWTNVSPMSFEVTINGSDVTDQNFTNAMIPPQPRVTSFELTPGKTAALKGSTITITVRALNVTVVDTNFNGMANITVTASKNASSVIYPQNVTFNNGIAILPVTSNIVQFVTFTATNDSITGSTEVAFADRVFDLDVGWNLISIPNFADPSSVDMALKNVKNNGVVGYDPATKTFSTPAGLQPLYGYWINVTAPDQSIGFIADTNITSVPPSRNLYEGWNLIGVVADEQDEIVDAGLLFQPLQTGGQPMYSFLVSYKDPRHTYAVGVDLTDRTRLNQGQGYWLFMKTMTETNKNSVVWAGKPWLSD